MDSVVDNEITEFIASMIKDDNLPFNSSVLNGTLNISNFVCNNTR
jgi:hypothetical protein